MFSTLSALAHALCYYLQIKARRVDLDMLWECTEREDDLQRQAFELSKERVPVGVLKLHTAKLRVVARARAAIERRIDGGADDPGQAHSEGASG